MLKIRLSRRGKKRQPSYRVVVADVDAPRDGRFVENIGYYNPLTEPSEYKIKEGRALYWLSVGAQPTDAVRRLLEKQGTFERLPRVHQGESVDALAAEFYGVPLEEPAEEEMEAPEAAVAAEAEAEVDPEPVAEADVDAEAETDVEAESDEPADAESDADASAEPAEEDAPAEDADDVAAEDA